VNKDLINALIAISQANRRTQQINQNNNLLSLADAVKALRSATTNQPFIWPLSSLITPPLSPLPTQIDFSRLSGLIKPTKRKVFISYHHGNDQWAFDYFSGNYGENLEIFYDNSLDGKVRSDDPEYVNRTIREEHIVGSSVTIVLIGPETWKRKYVDWEIRSTLHHEHALLGLTLHNASKTWDNKIIVPDRLYDNYVTGYAHIMDLSFVHGTGGLKTAIETAIEKSKMTQCINNSRVKMCRNIS